MSAMMDAIRTAAEKQLGLRFSPTKAPVEFLIVDRADKVPIDN
jgi:uncharacterized protein (TIGR03435 family)